MTASGSDNLPFSIAISTNMKHLCLTRSLVPCLMEQYGYRVRSYGATEHPIRGTLDACLVPMSERSSMILLVYSGIGLRLRRSRRVFRSQRCVYHTAFAKRKGGTKWARRVICATAARDILILSCLHCNSQRLGAVGCHLIQPLGMHMCR
jgi:hypothetical protein